MSPASLTALLAILLSPATSAAITIWLRRIDKRREDTEDTEITMRDINRTISHERDAAVSALKSAKEEFDKKLARLVETHNGEIATLTAQLVACKAETDRLYRELYSGRRSPPPS